MSLLHATMDHAIREAISIKSKCDKLYENKDSAGILAKTTLSRQVLSDSVCGLRTALDNVLDAYKTLQLQPPVVTTGDYVRKGELKELLSDLIPGLIGDALKSSNTVTPCAEAEPAPIEDTRHVVLIHGDNSKDDNSSGFGKNEWTEVVKKNISSKLKHIPIKKSIHTKEGKGCLILHDENVVAQVKDALGEDYNVEAASPKTHSKHIYPKLRIFDLDTDVYKKDSLETLRSDILLKNEGIKSLIENNADALLKVVMIHEDQSYAILKVSADVRSEIMKNGQRVFLGLTSHYARDHIHLMKCFTCQRHGHKSGSEHCSGTVTCAYCSKNHESSKCPDKNNKSAHNCANCSSVHSLKSRSKGHTTNDRKCPYALRETENLIKRTAGLNQQDFQKYLKRMNLG